MSYKEFIIEIVLITMFIVVSLFFVIIREKTIEVKTSVYIGKTLYQMKRDVVILYRPLSYFHVKDIEDYVATIYLVGINKSEASNLCERVLETEESIREKYRDGDIIGIMFRNLKIIKLHNRKEEGL